MIPHPNAMDSQIRAEDLAAAILSDANIPAVISTVAAHLRRHPSDQSRSFFSISFPTLILKLFAFDSSSSSSSSSSVAWIELPEAADLLFDLLRPDGLLLSATAAVDSHSLVRYAFPVERLPEWMRYVLLHPSVAAEISPLCPLLESRVRDGQLRLSVFEYYIFWFAYYPISKGAKSRSDVAFVSASRKQRMSRLESWAFLFSTKPNGGQNMEYSLYFRLLYAYLKAFVPKHGGSGVGSCVVVPYRSSLLHYTDYHDVAAMQRAEFLVHSFSQFWMVDNDFSPFSVSLCRSLGVSFPLRTVLGEAPPSVGLGEMLKLIVNHVNNGYARGTGKTLKGALGRSCDDFDGTWNLAIQRPLYRFILRTFLFCPMRTSMSNIAQVLSLWTHYMRPWKSARYFSRLGSSFGEKTGKNSINGESQAKEGSNNENEKSKWHSDYSPAWKSYVLSNYLFYNSLVVHFLGFAHKFLHTNTEVVLQMVLKVLDILTSSTEVLDLIRSVNIAYHSNSAGSSSASSNSYYKFIPSIREQLQDWEDGLCETDADGSFLPENWNHDLKLFSKSEDGAHQLLQLLLIRAEPEIQRIAGVKEAQNLQILASLKAQMTTLFGTTERWSLSPPPTKDVSSLQLERDGIFTPKGIGKRSWADVKYKGDWMRRPYSDNEVAWLAKLLIRLSDFLNEFLGLDRDGGNDEPSEPTYIVIPPSELDGAQNFKDAVWMFLAFVGSLIAAFVKTVLKFTRERGWRINLRVLASKKIVAAFLVFVGLGTLRRAFWTYC